MSELEKALREQKRLENVAQLHSDHERSRIDWRKALRRDRKKGKEILGDAANVRAALGLAPELIGLLRFNELSRRIEFTRSPPWRTLTRGAMWDDDDDIDFAIWLQQWGVPVRSEATITRIVHAHAITNAVHPVRDWLARLPAWDREPRIVETLIEVLSAIGEGQYLGAVLRRFMISAVARVMRPGCKVDHMLVLVGPQAYRKSSFALALGAPWSAESTSTFGTKDAIAELDGAWIVELGELAGLRKSEVETIKHFTSKQIDRYRPAYGHAVIDQPRACVFIGTTNEQRFLLDHTGNRRFWPVRIGGRIDLHLLKVQREALWAEAYAAYLAGEQWHLTDEEERRAQVVQELYRVVSEVEQETGAFLATVLADQYRKDKSVTVREVFKNIAGERERDNLSARRQMETQIGQAIRKEGWECIGRVGGEKLTTYVPPRNITEPAHGQPGQPI